MQSTCSSFLSLKSFFFFWWIVGRNRKWTETEVGFLAHASQCLPSPCPPACWRCPSISAGPFSPSANWKEEWQVLLQLEAAFSPQLGNTGIIKSELSVYSIKDVFCPAVLAFLNLQSDQLFCPNQLVECFFFSFLWNKLNFHFFKSPKIRFDHNDRR